MNDTMLDFNQEVRFAVVMYGGSSLAIYMNGVAQELFHLVRATAPKRGAEHTPGQAEVSGSEAVYRELGRILSRGEDPTRKITDSCIRTRFMIDIISGTSAGGINGVFLAKALVNDQDFESLKELWVEKGDVDILFNDNQSSTGKKIKSQKNPQSPFNSDLMYYELLNALEKMDQSSQTEKSSYVEELDLYTTATDIQGQGIKIKLADKVAEERRHNQFFHFTYKQLSEDGKERNDFKQDYNPFLAFAARCTSAHPAAFEPMKLADIDDIIARGGAPVTAKANDTKWDKFYEDYLHSDAYLQADEDKKKQIREDLRKAFQNRPFSDGGVLDNSPFSFVIDQLQFRDKKLPVDRKLVYVEPVPEHLSNIQEVKTKPNFLTNAAISLSTLPSYQFIRDDLKRLLQRNQLVERVNRILQGIERDESVRLEKAISTGQYRHPLNSTDFSENGMGGMIELMGTAWGGYQRLRVAQTTDDLALIFSRAAGFDEKSDEFIAIRDLVRVWRSDKYDAYAKAQKETELNGGNGKISENQFLYYYDLNWRIRRLKFVLKKVDEIKWQKLNDEEIRFTEGGNDFEEQAKMMVAAVKTAQIQQKNEEAAKKKQNSADENTTQIPQKIRDSTNLTREQFAEFSNQFDDFLNQSRNSPALQEMFPADLQKIKAGLSSTLKTLYKRKRELVSRLDDTGTVSSLKTAILELGITVTDLKHILDESEGRTTEEAAKIFYRKNKNNEKFEAFISLIEKKVSAIRIDIGGEVIDNDNAILKTQDLEATLTPEILIRTLLRYYYDNFDRYDLISFPILYSTNVGEETDIIEVFRISPEDADCLVTEKENRLKKLGGTQLGNFGAFFDKKFRINDILWGRLDCAERLITALLQSANQNLQGEGEELENKRRQLKAKREQLIRDAQRAIIDEELKSKYKEEICSLLRGATEKETIETVQSELLTPNIDPKMIEILQSELSGSNIDLKTQDYLLQCLRNGIENSDNLSSNFGKLYKFDHPLNPTAMLRASGRGSKIIGKILEGIANDQHLNQTPVRWFTRVTQLFWGLVEVSLPGSVPNLLWNHWRKLLYLLEFLLILFGTIFVNSAIQNFGFFLFGITVSFHAAALLLKDVMQGKRILPKLIAVVIGIVLLFGLEVGVSFFLALMDKDSKSWKAIEEFRANYIGHPDWHNTVLKWIPVVVVSLFFLYAVKDDLWQLIRKAKSKLSEIANA